MESLCAEYWQTLYSTIVSISQAKNYIKLLLPFPSFYLIIMIMQRMGAPYLIMCSENDDLAPFQTICNFAQSLIDLGGDVKLVNCSSSSHVGRPLKSFCFV